MVVRTPQEHQSSSSQNVTLVHVAGSLPVAVGALQVGQPGVPDADADADAVGIGIVGVAIGTVTVMVASDDILSTPYLIPK